MACNAQAGSRSRLTAVQEKYGSNKGPEWGQNGMNKSKNEKVLGWRGGWETLWAEDRIIPEMAAGDTDANVQL